MLFPFFGSKQEKKKGSLTRWHWTVRQQRQQAHLDQSDGGPASGEPAPDGPTRGPMEALPMVSLDQSVIALFQLCATGIYFFAAYCIH